MNILLINYEYPPTGGGAANETFFIAQHLANKNIHRPVVLTSRYKNLYGKTIQNGVVIYRVNAIRKRKERSNLFEMISYIFSACFSLPRILSLEKIDACIVFFSIPCGPIGLLAHYIKRIPYIVFLQGGDVPGNEASIRFLQSIVTPLRRLVMRKAIAVTANSVGLKKLSETHDPTLVHYISNGVDTSLFCPSLTVKDTTSRFLFLFVGRFQAQKNLIFLIEQIAKLRAQNQKEKFTLKLVGDGPDRKSIEYRIRQLNCHDVITISGWVDKNALVQEYQQSDCFINPSLYEGMPNTVLEAMACGLPVIASNVIGNNEVVIHGKTGFLFDLSDGQALINSMLKVMHNRQCCIDFGLSARASTEKYFSWDRVVEEYLGLFKSKIPLT